MTPFTAHVIAELNAFDLYPELIDELYYPDRFGDAITIFRLGNMLLKFTRDRSWDTLEIASANLPQRFYLLADVELAMGWKTMDETIAALNLREELRKIVCELKARLTDLQAAFAGPCSRFENANLQRAAREGFLPCPTNYKQ